MSKLTRVLCCAALAVLVLAPAAYAQRPGGQRPGQGGPGGRQGFQRSPTQLPRSIELSDDQKAKLAEIEEKYADKLKAATEKSALTEDQQTAMREAFAKARENNTPREEMREVMEKAVTLTDDQKKGREEMTALRAEITKAVEEILTDEQKEQLKAARERGRGQGQRPGGDRPGGARPGNRPQKSDT